MSEGPDTSRYHDYLVLNRSFLTPAVAAAVDVLARADAPGARVLEVGCGAGGALPALARLADGGGLVDAADLSDVAVEVAREFLADRRLPAPVEVHLADGLGRADAARAAGTPYDLVWAADVVWPAVFPDPAATVARLARALAPGGRLALFASNYYQSMFLPGHSRLERLLRTASELTWGLPWTGPHHPERLGAWLAAAGLAVELHPCPRAGLLTQDDDARAYVREIVWPEMLHAARTRGRDAGMTAEDLTEAEELLDPEGDRYVGVDPDAFVVQPALLWVGTAP